MTPSELGERLVYDYDQKSIHKVLAKEGLLAFGNEIHDEGVAATTVMAKGHLCIVICKKVKGTYNYCMMGLPAELGDEAKEFLIHFAQFCVKGLSVDIPGLEFAPVRARLTPLGGNNAN